MIRALVELAKVASEIADVISADDDTFEHRNLAVAYLHMGLLEAAIAELVLVVRARPDDTKTQQLLAELRRIN